MSVQGSQAEDVEQSTSGQFSIPVGLMFGLLAASVLCLGYAWFHRDPQGALNPDPGAIDSMLWRTTIVVGISACLVLGSYVAGGLNRIRSDWRSQFFAYVSAALVVLAVSGLLMLRLGRTKEVFAEAQEAQEALIPFDVAAVARWAWWCACLAVIALALVAVARHGVAPSPRPFWASRLLAGAVALAVVSIVAVSVLATGARPMGNQTASRIEAPALATVEGRVAYRISGSGSTPMPAGAGFVRVLSTPTGRSKADTIEGYDGASGQRRWAFGPVGELSVVGSTGIGPDSVVLAQAGGTILIGIDATTGNLLWFKSGDSAWDTEKTAAQMSSNVIVAVRRAPGQSGTAVSEAGTVWDALSPRTGEVLWSKTFGYQCYPQAFVAADFVVARSMCGDDAGVMADVYDARTGAPAQPVRLSALGLTPADIAQRKGGVSIDDVSDDAVLVTVSIYEPTRIERRLVVGLAPGSGVRQLPEHRAAGFIDNESVALVEYRGRGELPVLSILDLATNKTIPVGFTSERISGAQGALSVVRVGTQWWTLVPADESAKAVKFSAPLRSIDASGTAHDFSSPCPAVSQVPSLTIAAGALLVHCGSSEWPAVR